jgi:hypothetical protein
LKIAEFQKQVVFCVALTFVPFLASAQTAPEAPVPAALITAKKAFISNMGFEACARVAFSTVKLSPYNMFYASMRDWGHFDLVSAPADADVVFEIRMVAPGCGSGAAEFLLAAIDAKTHFVLWTINTPVPVAYRKETIQKNVGLAMSNLINDLKKITSAPTPSSAHQ